LTDQPDASKDESVNENAAATPEETPGQHETRPYQGGPETWNLDSLPPELDYFRSSEAYQVELSGFQGPMDLLLYLINKEQVDIYDIPIARITDQFIKHIEVMQAISLDTAGEFIAMAATLMVIKMKMLMPSHRDDDDDEEEDPRAELVRKLLEYKRFKEAAEALQKAESDRRQYHLRQTRFPFTDDLDLEPKLRIEMFDLLSALAGIYDRIQAKPIHEVEREPYTVEEKMSLIEEKIGGGHMVNFLELFADIGLKMEVIVTFIAILELVKRGRLEFLQTEPRGPIWIQRPGIRDEDDAGEPEHHYVVADEDHPEEDLDIDDYQGYQAEDQENDN
jgi:segregation and condensation protein A